MTGFKYIVGYKQTIEQLRNAIRGNKVSHAYIIEGPKGAGKKMLAKAFAATLQCETEGEEACGVCHSCKMADSNNHPDIIYVTPQKTKNVSVDDIREQINSDIAIKPYSGKKKIYIIEHAENMNPQSQNALLKTIEEPPEYGIIILLTENKDALLPTILSRCVEINLRPLSDDLIKDYLIYKKNIPNDRADLCVAFAQGVMGKALMLAESEDFVEIKDDAISLLHRMDDIGAYEMSAAVKEIKEYNMDANEFLDLLLVWYRDVLLFKATQDANSLVFKEEAMEIKRQAQKASYEGIEKILKSLERAKSRLKANVNYELTMELLLEVIKENMQ